jgi:hypothetical protein
MHSLDHAVVKEQQIGRREGGCAWGTTPRRDEKGEKIEEFKRVDQAARGHRGPHVAARRVR